MKYEGKSIDFKKGDGVIIPIFAIQHMDEYFPDPEVFNLDRFLNENRDQLVPYTFLAFVDGPRNCVGKRFALMEAKLALSNLLVEFDFVRSPNTTVPIDLNGSKFLLTPKEVTIQLKPRES